MFLTKNVYFCQMQEQKNPVYVSFSLIQAVKRYKTKMYKPIAVFADEAIREKLEREIQANPELKDVVNLPPIENNSNI